LGESRFPDIRDAIGQSNARERDSIKRVRSDAGDGQTVCHAGDDQRAPRRAARPMGDGECTIVGRKRELGLHSNGQAHKQDKRLNGRTTKFFD
jgi:hypothetical protein